LHQFRRKPPKLPESKRYNDTRSPDDLADRGMIEKLNAMRAPALQMLSSFNITPQQVRQSPSIRQGIQELYLKENVHQRQISNLNNIIN
jgi:hypothetical protein